MEYWPWWFGAIALTMLSVMYFLMIGRMLGVSGSWAKVVNWRNEKEMEAETAIFFQNESISAELMQETLAEFGELSDAELKELQLEMQKTSANENTEQFKQLTTSWTVHLVFLLSMSVGGFIAAITTGQFQVQWQLSELHSQIFGTDWQAWLALFCGGIMVGFGTQMSGGCTSGHGLSGCSRIIPVSLLATAVFMLCAIVLSVLMKASIS